MKKKSSLRTNVVFSVIYQLSATIMPMITAPYISRVVGADGLGAYSYYHSIALYFVYFAMLGILNYANRIIAKHVGSKEDLNKKFSSIYYLQLIMSIVVLAAYVVYLSFFVRGDKTVPIIMVLHVLSAIFDVSWLFFGLQEFKLTSIRQLVIRVVSFISLFVFVKTKNDLWIYTLIMSLGYFLSSVSLWVMMFKRVRLVRCEIKNVFRHFKPCLVLFIPIIATTVYRLMDKIMIGNYYDMDDVGYYENAEKLLLVSSSLLGAIATVIMPKMSSLLSKKKNKKFRRLFAISMDFCMMLAFAIAAGIAGISKEFVPIFFGSGFNESIGLSIMLCVSLPFMIWSMMIRNLFLIPHELDKIYVKSVVIGAVVNFCLNIILIPKNGAYGAVIGTIAADVCLAIFQTLPIRSKINISSLMFSNVVYLAIGLIMVGVIRLMCGYLPNNAVGLIIEIIIGAVTYASLSLVYFMVGRHYTFGMIKDLIIGKR